MVDGSMRRAWWELSTAIIDACRAAKLDITSVVYKAKSDLSSQLTVRRRDEGIARGYARDQ